MLDGSSARKFIKKFLADPPDQPSHTFAELLVGAYLYSIQMPAKYDRWVLDKKPDWSLINEADAPIGIIEQMTFHQARNIEDEIKATLSSGQTWCDFPPSNVDRLYERIREKAEKYENLVAQLNLPYVVSIFGHFFADVDSDEINEVLFKLNGGAFSNFKTLTGVLYFTELNGSYSFSYIPSPNATFHLPLRDNVI
jgi:hypothetical protein